MLVLSTLLCSWALTGIIRTFFLKKKLLDIPNERSSHTLPTPHGGGIAIGIVWFAGMVYLYVFGQIAPSLFHALLAGVVLCVISYVDDVYTISPKVRLMIHALVACAGIYSLGGIARIDLGVVVLEHAWITNIVAFLCIIWSINLYNFLDGIDGYAGSEGLFLALFGFVVFGGDVYVLLGASILGFLVWNWQPAKIFMGDVGSTLLGYSIAIMALYHQNEGSSLLIWLIVYGLFWFDATLTIIRRYRNHEKIIQAHKKHGYQRLVQSGWSHQKVVLFAQGVNLLLGVLGYIAFMKHEWLLGCFLLSVGFLYGIMKRIDAKKKFEL